MASSFLVVRLTHTGVDGNDNPNKSSILISDLEVGYEYQNRKSAVYVPYSEEGDGHIDIPLTNRVAFSMAEGAIYKLVDAGYITVDTFVSTNGVLSAFPAPPPPPPPPPPSNTPLTYYQTYLDISIIDDDSFYQCSLNIPTPSSGIMYASGHVVMNATIGSSGQFICAATSTFDGVYRDLLASGSPGDKIVITLPVNYIAPCDGTPVTVGLLFKISPGNGSANVIGKLSPCTALIFQ
jgi:hypothetical protein